MKMKPLKLCIAALPVTALFATVAGSLAFAQSPTLHGPNINPSNLAVVVEWEKFVGRPADIIGDNLSANTWDVFLDAGSFDDPAVPNAAMANALERWKNAFDGDDSTGQNEGFPQLSGEPAKALTDYELEIAVPMFPGEMRDYENGGGLRRAHEVGSRWKMYEPDNPHHAEAKAAFGALAQAMVDANMGHARIRLAWEFTGGWFPWGLSTLGAEGNVNAQVIGTPEDFKKCWRFIHQTMEEVNPEFEWVWCGHINYGPADMDPTAAFPVFDNNGQTEIYVDYVAADVYDSDGEHYWRADPQPGYWNAHPDEQEQASLAFFDKVVEGDGAGPNQSPEVGLRFFKNIADQYGLPFSISEFGVWSTFVLDSDSTNENPQFKQSYGFGGDDNPFFINGILDWMEAEGVNSAAYFELHLSNGDIIDHSLLPGFWEREEGRPEFAFHASTPFADEFGSITNQSSPRAAAAYVARVGTTGPPDDCQFEDDFNDNLIDPRWSVSSSRWDESNGAMNINFDHSERETLLVADKVWTGIVSASFDLALVNANDWKDAGVVFFDSGNGGIRVGFKRNAQGQLAAITIGNGGDEQDDYNVPDIAAVNVADAPIAYDVTATPVDGGSLLISIGFASANGDASQWETLIENPVSLSGTSGIYAGSWAGARFDNFSLVGEGDDNGGGEPGGPMVGGDVFVFDGFDDGNFDLDIWSGLPSNRWSENGSLDIFLPGREETVLTNEDNISGSISARVDLTMGNPWHPVGLAFFDDGSGGIRVGVSPNFDGSVARVDIWNGDQEINIFPDSSADLFASAQLQTTLIQHGDGSLTLNVAIDDDSLDPIEISNPVSSSGRLGIYTSTWGDASFNNLTFEGLTVEP